MSKAMNLDFSYHYDILLAVRKGFVAGVNNDEVALSAYCVDISDATDKIVAANLESLRGRAGWGFRMQPTSHPETLWKELHQIEDILNEYELQLSGRILLQDKDDDIYMFLADKTGLSRKKATFVDI